MLVFDNPYDVPVEREAVVDAVRLLCHAQLVSVAKETNLPIYRESFNDFAELIEGAINNPDILLTPSQLVTDAQLFAMRGAQAMLAAGLTDDELRFHEWTWRSICPVFPFC